MQITSSASEYSLQPAKVALLYRILEKPNPHGILLVHRTLERKYQRFNRINRRASQTQPPSKRYFIALDLIQLGVELMKSATESYQKGLLTLGALQDTQVSFFDFLDNLASRNAQNPIKLPRITIADITFAIGRSLEGWTCPELVFERCVFEQRFVFGTCFFEAQVKFLNCTFEPNYIKFFSCEDLRGDDVIYEAPTVFFFNCEFAEFNAYYSPLFFYFKGCSFQRFHADNPPRTVIHRDECTVGEDFIKACSEDGLDTSPADRLWQIPHGWSLTPPPQQ